MCVSLLPSLLLLAAPARAWIDLEAGVDPRERAQGIHILDGSYVMNVGELRMNITNHGLIGSRFSTQSTYSDAPSAEWPAGSSIEHLYGAGLWVGGVVLGEERVTTGFFEREFRPLDDIEDTIYEAIDGRITRPPGNVDAGGKRAPDPEPDDDGDGLIDEEILNGYDDDGDGLIDEDFGQLGKQMMTSTQYDYTRLSQELYPDHNPMYLKVVEKSFQWEGDAVNDFVAFEFDITNTGATPIDNVYLGFFADCDIGPRENDDAAQDDMAGFFDGVMRASDGSYVPLSVGYMYDDAESNPVPSYIGILFLGQPGTPGARIRSYQNFSGQSSFENGGDPTNDQERYELMSADEFDPNVSEGRRNDFRFMVSGGPWQSFEPGQTLRFQSAIVVGVGLEGLLRNCAEAYLTWFGSYFDLDNVDSTGIGGRETRICVPDLPNTGDPIFQMVADYMDQSCLSANVPLNFITREDFVLDPRTGMYCLWVDMDNCDECDRLAHTRCTSENDNFLNFWNCNDLSIPPDLRSGCTGVGGRESRVQWLVGMAPPPPGMRIWEEDNANHVYWNDLSEHVPDLRLNEIDFESYRVWRADNWDRPFGSSEETGPASDLWQLLDEYDVVNDYYRERVIDRHVYRDTIPLGRNTGFDEVIYRPRCLDDPRFAGLAEAMDAVVQSDTGNRWSVRPALRGSDGTPVPQLVSLLPWEGYPAVLDTFFETTGRDEDLDAGVVGKRSTRFYEYVDRDVHNGFIYFYSVTASDHELGGYFGRLLPTGPGLQGLPNTSFQTAVPATPAQTAAERAAEGVNIYVYPNPATETALHEFQQLSPNGDDPTGRRIRFANLPQAHNTIQIFTLDGDLVQTIRQDGSGGYGEATWNLVSRNGQQVSSGVYLYSVQSDDDRFEDFIGKFVVIR